MSPVIPPSRRTSSSSRRRAAVIVPSAVLGGALLALAVPAAAGAHVGVSPDDLVAGEHGVLTFSFSHGCDDSPTTALRITMPEGLASVAPTLDGDWDIAVERGDDGLVSAVTYTALEPVPTDLRGAVSMSVGLDADTPGTLAFPVVQQCAEGATEWTQLAAEGEDPHSLDSPAPVVTVSESAGSDSAHGGEDAHDGTAGSAVDDTADAPLATALGAGGLVAGAAALVVAILAYRRRV